MNNTVIEVLNKEHGQEVKNYWESRGVDVDGFSFRISRESENEYGYGYEYRYYGIIDCVFGNYSLDEVKASNAKIIELTELKTPEQLPIPRMVLVSDPELKEWEKKELLADLTKYNVEFPYVCRNDMTNTPVPYRYMKELPKEITKEEAEKLLSELKGEEIKIK